MGADSNASRMQRMSRIEIITIGDELIEGRLVDTNAGELSAKLMAVGLRPAEHRSVGDDMDDIVEALRTAAARADAVLVSGGLGPTGDDLTAEAAAAAFDTGVTRYDEALEHARRFFAERGRAMPASNEKQADLPRGCAILPNSEGTAVGFRMDVGRCRLYFMPGVPRELRRMADESVIPDLRRRLEARPSAVATIRLFGLGESDVADRLAGIEGIVPDGLDLTVQYRATFPEIHVRLVFDNDGDAEQAALKTLTAAACERLGDSVFAVGSERLDTDFPAAVADTAASRGLTIAAAEVASGGGVCRLLSRSDSGARVFAGGCVAPDRDALKRQLGASSNAATELAAAVRARLGADIGLATLGSADGGDGVRPGAIEVAAVGPAGAASRELYFPIDRARFQKLAAYAGLKMVMKTAVEDHAGQPSG